MTTGSTTRAGSTFGHYEIRALLAVAGIMCVANEVLATCSGGDDAAVDAY